MLLFFGFQLGDTLKTEYLIHGSTLEISTHDKNYSEAVAKILFRRRMEYHVTNTLFQKFMLLLIGFLSFFFDLDDFTDRIMVTLTTMLVIATLTSSIQSVSVKDDPGRLLICLL